MRVVRHSASDTGDGARNVAASLHEILGAGIFYKNMIIIDAFEDCKLVAAYMGDGYSLEVLHNGEVIAYLSWPKSWPDKVTDSFLIQCGFEIEP